MAKKLIPGTNDLATTHPEIAQQADGWDPTTVIASSKKRRNWKCEKEHSWKVGCYNRTGPNRKNCPVCANQQILAGYNDLMGSAAQQR